MVIAKGSITVTKFEYDTVHVDVYETKLQAILQMVNYGDVGGGNGWGSESHRRALVEIAGHIGKIIAKIDSPPPPDPDDEVEPL